MKSATRNILTLLTPMAFLAIGSVAYAGTPTATTYTDDDLFIGFHQAGNTSDYLVNIGQASTLTATRTLSIGDIASDLAAVFGGAWSSDSTISWGVVGTTHLTAVGSDPAHTIYASKQGNASSVTAWNTGSSSYLATPDSRIYSMAQAYSGKVSTGNSPTGLIQNNVATKALYAYASCQPGGGNSTATTSFSLFNPTIEASNASGITASSAVLALFRLAPGPTAAGTAVGTLSINSSGTVTFTVASTSAYNTWASSYSLSGANALPTATPANDGIENMVKFVLGANPNSGSNAQFLPTAVPDATNLTFSFPHNAASMAEYDVAVDTSTDLLNWTPAPAGTESGGRYTTVILKNGAPKLFTRLRVTQK